MSAKEGILWVGNRCYRVAKVFDECTPRREKIAKDVAQLYRNGRYLGGCVIMYEVDPELCNMLKKSK